jgi:hypothetical protein
LEASARPAEVFLRGPWVWNDREAFWDRGAWDNGGAVLFEECRVQDREMLFEGFAAVRAAATMLRVEFIAVDTCWKEP